MFPLKVGQWDCQKRRFAVVRIAETLSRTAAERRQGRTGGFPATASRFREIYPLCTVVSLALPGLARHRLYSSAASPLRCRQSRRHGHCGHWPDRKLRLSATAMTIPTTYHYVEQSLHIIYPCVTIFQSQIIKIFCGYVRKKIK